MKKLISLLLFLTMIPLVAKSQTNIYDSTGDIQGDGYIYTCVHKHKFIVNLYNKENTITLQNAKQVNKATGIPVNNIRGKLVEDDDWTYEKCQSICAEKLDSYLNQTEKTAYVYVAVFVSPDTGRITDIVFEFGKNSTLAQVPISVFHEIETRLKNEVWFVPTPLGKTLNFISRGFVRTN